MLARRRAWLPALTRALAALLGITTCSASAASDFNSVELDEARAGIRAFQGRDQKLQNIGWALARGNAAYCDRIIPSVGLQLQDIQSYGEPAIARAALGVESDFAVQTAARGSPAAKSGAFTRNREIVSISGFDPNTLALDPGKRWERVTRVHDRITEMFATQDTLTFTFADGSSETLAPVPICETDFVLINTKNKRLATGGFGQVAIGSAVEAFTYDEPVFAGMVAHEFAHSLFRHTRWLRLNKRKQRNKRATEREADRMMPWLMANAGYDPQAGVVFVETWLKRYSYGIFRDRAYDAWNERAENISAEIAIVRDFVEREGKADWATHFQRGIDPFMGMSAQDILAEKTAADAAKATFAALDKRMRAREVRIAVDESALSPDAFAAGERASSSGALAMSSHGARAKVSARLCEMVYITALWRTTSPLHPALARACWLSSQRLSLPTRTRPSGSSS